MMWRNRQPRAGFTLIELLVVMAIIAVLVGLTIAGVMKVLSTNPRTETIARMKGIDTAIGTFKADRFGGAKGYIPAGQVDITPGSPTFGQVVGPFRLRNSYTASTVPDVNSFEAQYIAQVFGRVNLADLGGSSILGSNTILLDANQTLLFFLGGIPAWNGQGGVAFTGFSNNPAQPFMPAVAGSGESRKGPYVDLPPKMVSLDSATAFPRLIDGYGQPFAYFVAFNQKAGFYGGFNSTFGNAQPYVNGGKFVNENGYQLISAGQDKAYFGATNNWASLDQPSMDNLANFSTKVLGAGPTAQ